MLRQELNLEKIKIKPKIGLLPFYLKLYDDAIPKARVKIENFLNKIETEINKRDIIVFKAPICRLKNEFQTAIDEFEKREVDAILTLHLAYSPSLESIEPLLKTSLPLIILDTTPDFEFGPFTNPDKLIYNHGIHGVQDLCSLLIRNNKYFAIEAGHWEKSNIIEKILTHIWASYLLKRLKSSVVGRIGGAFKGMGDFDVEPKILKETIGIKVLDVLPDEINKFIPSPNSNNVRKEIESDINNFTIKNVSNKCHVNSVRMSLALRSWIEEEKLSAFTMNFSNIDDNSGFVAIPFFEACKAMTRGVGYAGEGDALTAALLGAILRIFNYSTFIEMFCPDWKNNRIFLSHMGEINLNSIQGKPVLLEKKVPFLNKKFENSLIVAGGFKPGKAIIINLAPSKNNKYTFIMTDIEVDEIKKDRFEKAIRGWIVPGKPISEFLKDYSESGGTHHSILIYKNSEHIKDILISFGKQMSWNLIEL
jgi:L-arabinose isomerase